MAPPHTGRMVFFAALIFLAKASGDSGVPCPDTSCTRPGELEYCDYGTMHCMSCKELCYKSRMLRHKRECLNICPIFMKREYNIGPSSHIITVLSTRATSTPITVDIEISTPTTILDHTQRKASSDVTVVGIMVIVVFGIMAITIVLICVGLVHFYDVCGRNTTVTASQWYNGPYYHSDLNIKDETSYL